MITIAIPVLNEREFIGECLRSLLAQVDESQTEILVLDGGSTDGTLEIVSEVRTRHRCIRIIPNPGRIQAVAINLAAQEMSPASPILIRADAHAVYPPDFVALCVSALRDNEATSVVVPMVTVGRSGFQRAVAAIQNSLLGNGGSAHRRAGARSGFVEHGHHAAFDARFFRSLGGYDEQFTHNEDAEFDVRVLKSGGRIWMCREAVVSYFPRKTVGALARQYYNHGRGRASTVSKHRLVPKLRQMAPVAAVGGSAGAALLAPIAPVALIVPLAYVALCGAWSVSAAVRHREPALLAAGIAAATMHASWAVGFTASAIRFRLRRRGRPAVPAAQPSLLLAASERPLKGKASNREAGLHADAA